MSTPSTRLADADPDRRSTERSADQVPHPAQATAEFMRDHALVLVTAESCTGGLIAANLSDLPGAGQLLDCAFVTYTPAAKQRCLGVKPETIERFNLTSEEVAREMALGAVVRSDGNVAVSNTGVTDDTDPAIPSGTQCFAWAFDGELCEGGTPVVFSERRVFSGERRELRQASAEYALQRIPHYFKLAKAKRSPDG